MIGIVFRSSVAAAEMLKHGFAASWRAALQREWSAFKKSRPGKRFEDRYFRKRHANRPAWLTFLKPGLGLVIIALGLFLLPAPGPGIPVVLLGFGLVAEHFLFVATLLDRCEPPLRSAVAACRRWWKATSVIARCAIGVVAGVLVLASSALLFVLLA